MDSNGSGEAGGQQKSSPSTGSEKIAGKLGGEDDWQLREDLMGAFEGALDAGGKRGDLQGIRVLKNDRVMGARAGGGPCFGNCEDDEGAEWVRRPASTQTAVRSGGKQRASSLVAGYQITFQVKRVRKTKADEVDSLTIAEDGSSREEMPGAHSILEISGPTIPSPGPSGNPVCPA